MTGARLEVTRFGRQGDSMMEDGFVIKTLRNALATAKTQHIELILLEHGSMFENLPDDLEKRRAFLNETLEPFSIPPVADVKSWMRGGARVKK